MPWTFYDRSGQKRVNSGMAMTAQELAYVQVTAAPTAVAVATSATAQTVMTLPSIVADGISPLIVEVDAIAAIPHSAGIGSVTVSLWEGATELTHLCTVTNEVASTNLAIPIKGKYRFAPSAGPHTYTIKAFSTTTAWDIWAGSGGVAGNPPFFARITRADWAVYNPGAVPKMTTGLISAGPPANPNDGDIWIATAVDANGTRWHFQYNAGSASAYKWEFIGGAPYIAVHSASVVMNTVSVWWDLMTTNKPLCPRLGNYNVRYQTSIVYGGGAGDLVIGLGIAGNPGNYLWNNLPQTGAQKESTLRGLIQAFDVPAGATMGIYGDPQGSTTPSLTAATTSIEITPVRVS
jgi:hypothetical protein